jgi:hypothetical protein
MMRSEGRDSRQAETRFADGVSSEIGGFVVEVRLPDLVVVSSPRSVDRYVDPDLAVGTEVVLWHGRRCGVVAGRESSRLIVLDPGSGQSAAALIERLRLPSYDPGGLHRLGFFDADGDVLVTTEIGVPRSMRADTSCGSRCTTT